MKSFGIAFWKIGLFITGILGGYGTLRAQPDSALLMQLITEAQELEGNDPQKAKTMYVQVKKQSEKMGWTLGILKFYTNYTAVLNQQGHYDSALLLNLESVKLARQYGDPYYNMATLMNTGISYNYLNDPATAIAYYLQALPIADRLQNSRATGILCDNLGNAFDAIKNHNEAKRYYYKAIQLYKTERDTIGLCYTYNNLAKTLTYQQKYDSAKALVEAGMGLNRLIDNQYVTMIFQLNLTNIFLHERQYSKMLIPGHIAYLLSGKLSDWGAQSNACYALSWAHLLNNQPDSAQYYGIIGLNAARQTDSQKEIAEMLQLLAQVALLRKDLSAFDTYQKQSDSLAENVLNANIQNSTMALAARYEASQKEAAIALLEKEARYKKWWIMVLAGGLLLSGIAIWLFRRTGRQRSLLAAQEAALQKARIAELEKEKQLLAGQALLKGQEEERSRLSRELHDGLGSMLSGIKLSLGAMKGNVILAAKDAQVFAGALQKLDETISEMRRVAHSMMPEALLRLGLNEAINDYCGGLEASGKLHIQYQQFGMEERLPGDVEIVIYRIVQELFSNVIKHAAASQVILQLMRHGDMLTLTFEDNGKGMDIKGNPPAQGAGLQNIQARTDYLKGQLDIRSAPGKGTSVHIEIPLAS
ncbi:MAG: sensor histidine kinase [Chitinophagaceae bacterium]|nr:sensor histidine kinase [Chitinophagaceae bacterium]